MFRIIAPVTAFLMTVGVARAEELTVGSKAPEFKLKASDGKTHSLAEFKGKKAVVIAWFPKAFTGGCTAQCKSLARSAAKFDDFAVAVFAASVDPVDTNADFAKSLDLGVPILSDPEKEIAKAYGVVHGNRQVAERWTFYIDKEGIIKHIDKKVKTAAHGDDILAKLKELRIASK